MMVCGDVWWCVVVCGIVCGMVWWCSVEGGGVWLRVVVGSSGMRWRVVV